MVHSVILPRVSFTSDEATDLRTTAALLEAEVLAHFEDFLTRQRRHVDRSKWKYARNENDLEVYNEIHNVVDELGFMSSSPVRISSTEPQAALAAESAVGRVLITGTMPGSVDDALYGCSFFDTVSLRTKEAYQREFLADSAVLVTIDGPTPEDPFRFLGVTWHLRTSRFAKSHDTVLLMHTHLSTLSTGERIGVTVRQSIKLRGMPEFTDPLPRVMISSVTIFRQFSVGTVDVFGLELLDHKSRIMSIATQRSEAARDLLVSALVCDSSNKKKLHWLMRRRHRDRTNLGTIATDTKRCGLCTKSTSGLFSLSSVTCRLCTKHVCSRCTMDVDIVVDATTAQVVAKPFAFCIECLLQTKKLSAMELAQDEVQQLLSPEKSRISSSSTNSLVSIQ